jgi:hypothetical protein
MMVIVIVMRLGEVWNGHPKTLTRRREDAKRFLVSFASSRLRVIN